MPSLYQRKLAPNLQKELTRLKNGNASERQRLRVLALFDGTPITLSDGVAAA